MFNSIGAYFLFVIPCTILLAIGIIFEDKLVAFEDYLLDSAKHLFKKISNHFRKDKIKLHIKHTKKIKNHNVKHFEMSA